MKIALMSGALVNAGDFLIEERCRNLLEENLSGVQIDTFIRNVSYDNQVDMLNAYDRILFGGGPGFQKNLYPDRMPFVSNLKNLTPPPRDYGLGLERI